MYCPSTVYLLCYVNYFLFNFLYIAFYFQYFLLMLFHFIIIFLYTYIYTHVTFHLIFPVIYFPLKFSLAYHCQHFLLEILHLTLYNFYFKHCLLSPFILYFLLTYFLNLSIAFHLKYRIFYFTESLLIYVSFLTSPFLSPSFISYHLYDFLICSLFLHSLYLPYLILIEALCYLIAESPFHLSMDHIPFTSSIIQTPDNFQDV